MTSSKRAESQSLGAMPDAHDPAQCLRPVVRPCSLWRSWMRPPEPPRWIHLDLLERRQLSRALELVAHADRIAYKEAMKPLPKCASSRCGLHRGSRGGLVAITSALEHG